MTMLALALICAPISAPCLQEPEADKRPGFLSFEEGDPDRKRGLQGGLEGAEPGYVFIAPLNGTATHLVDRSGTVRHTWEHESSPASGSYLLDDGTLIRCGRADKDVHFRGGGIGGILQKVAPDGTLLWSWRLADENTHHHHDIEPLPNGNILLIAWERISQADAGLHGRAKHHVGKAGLWTDKVMEIRPVLPDRAEVVWEWRSWNHVVQDAYEGRKAFAYPSDHPGRIDINAEHRDAPPLDAAQRAAVKAREEGMAALGYVGGEDPDDEHLEKLDRDGDWMHTNSIDYHPGLDLILLSSPELNEIFLIDHSTTTAEAATSKGGRWGRGGELLWRWGNPRNYGAGTDSDRRLWYQHDPSFLDGPPDELRILVFNNGSGRSGDSFSSVLELVLPWTPEQGFTRHPDAAWGPVEPAWEYSDPGRFYSAFISGAERLAGGNTLICSGAAGRAFEVDAAGKLVWDYYNPLGGDVDPPDHAGNAPPLALFRAEHVAPDHPGLKALGL